MALERTGYMQGLLLSPDQAKGDEANPCRPCSIGSSWWRLSCRRRSKQPSACKLSFAAVPLLPHHQAQPASASHPTLFPPHSSPSVFTAPPAGRHLGTARSKSAPNCFLSPPCSFAAGGSCEARCSRCRHPAHLAAMADLDEAAFPPEDEGRLWTGACPKEVGNSGWCELTQ